jgi:thiol-disulfide isomerase/thioredoxin
MGAHVSFEPGPSPIDAEQAWGDLTLVTGETIPCRIGTVDDTGLQATFPGGHTASIPRDQLRAVRLYSPRTWIYAGFRDSDKWYASTREAGAVAWQPERLEFYKPALLAREIPEKTRLAVQFDLQFHGTVNSNVVVGIGADEPQHALRRPNDHVASEEALREAAKERPDYVVEVIMTRHRNSLTARGVNKAAGVLGIMFEANPFAAEERITSLALGENYAVHVEIRIDPIAREYAIFGNGQEMHRWRDTSPLEGKLLYFGATGEQDSVSRPAQSGNSQDANRPLATFHNFRIQRWSGEMRSDDRERFLTRRVGASPKAVTHVLRAWNGDSLRGRLVGVTADHVEFQSRLDTLTIPREKVAEIIQLPPPTAESPAEGGGAASASGSGTEAGGTAGAEAAKESAADSGRVVLRRGGSLILRKIRATDQWLQGECSVAPISIPWSEVAEIYFAVTSVPQSPYADWALRNPPPLPEMPASAGPQEPSPLLGKAAPEVRLKMLDGQPTTLKDLRGRVVILDFWASWCGPCLASMPSLMEIAQDEALRDKVSLIAVNQQEEPEVVREFLASQLWKLDVALDRDGELGKLFGAGAIPHTVLVDREGVIRHVHVGATPDLKQDLMGKIEALLADPGSAAPEKESP